MDRVITDFLNIMGNIPFKLCITALIPALNLMICVWADDHGKEKVSTIFHALFHISVPIALGFILIWIGILVARFRIWLR